MEESTPQTVCEEISSEVREIASWLSEGQLSAEKFRLALLVLEERKVTRFGFKLTGATQRNGRVHFELRSAEDESLCATLDYQSGSEALKVEHLCG